jgi:hypothetical protein
LPEFSASFLRVSRKLPLRSSDDRAAGLKLPSQHAPASRAEVPRDGRYSAPASRDVDCHHAAIAG